MFLKLGVKVGGISPEMVLAARVVETMYERLGFSCTITSCMDGVHGQNSLHYQGKALDFRTRDVLASVLPDLAANIKAALGAEFDVVLEEDHIHVEFDPD